MPTIQQIIDGLNCFTTNQHKCIDCPFNPHPGMKWVYGCIKGQGDIVKAAQGILRKHREVMWDDQRVTSSLDRATLRGDGHVRDGDAGGEQEGRR